MTKIFFFGFPFFNEGQKKTTQRIKKIFSLVTSWIANYQITKCVLNLLYDSKPKNSTEAFYEGNPQPFSFQPIETLCIVWIIVKLVIKLLLSWTFLLNSSSVAENLKKKSAKYLQMNNTLQPLFLKAFIKSLWLSLRHGLIKILR